MKTLIFVLGLFGLISGTAANAQEVDRYCAIGASGMQCTFATMEECKATFNTSGAGGANCMLNPKYKNQENK